MRYSVPFKNPRLFVRLVILVILFTYSKWESKSLAQTGILDPQPTVNPHIEAFAVVKEGRALLLYQPQSTAYNVLDIAARQIESSFDFVTSASQVKSFGHVSRVYPILETGQMVTIFEQEPPDLEGNMGTYTVVLTDMTTQQERTIYAVQGLGIFSFSPQYDVALVGSYVGANIRNTLTYCILDLRNNVCTTLPIIGTIYSAIEWISDYEFVGLQRPKRIDKIDIKELSETVYKVKNYGQVV